MISLKQLESCLATLSDCLPIGAPNFKNPDVFKFWLSRLQKLDAERVLATFSRAAETCRAFPAFVDFMGIYEGVACGDVEVGADVVAQIEIAVARVGAWWEAGQIPRGMDETLERVRGMVGDLGWEFVQLKGGWWNLCNNVVAEGLTEFERTSWVKMINVLYKQRRAFGPSPEPIGIPGARADTDRAASHYLKLAAEESKPPPEAIAPVPEVRIKAQPSRFSSAVADFRREVGA